MPPSVSIMRPFPMRALSTSRDWRRPLIYALLTAVFLVPILHVILLAVQ